MNGYGIHFSDHHQLGIEHLKTLYNSLRGKEQEIVGRILHFADLLPTHHLTELIQKATEEVHDMHLNESLRRIAYTFEHGEPVGTTKTV